MFMLMITGTLCLSSCGFFMPLGNKHYFIYIFMTFVIYLFFLGWSWWHVGGFEFLLLKNCFSIPVFLSTGVSTSDFQGWRSHLSCALKTAAKNFLTYSKRHNLKPKFLKFFFQRIIKVVKHPGYRCLFLLLHVADIKLLQAVICPSSYRADWNEPVTFYRRIL